MWTDHAFLQLGDCREALATLPENCIDAVVTDPPYHLTQVSRNGSPRTNDPETPFGRHHIGERGFMGRTWDGGDVAFRPETWAAVLRVAKPGAHLLAFGGTRTFHRLACAIEDAGWDFRDTIMWCHAQGFPKSKNLDGDWEGWGTALKPAVELIAVARKPFDATVAENVQQWGTGAINIDGCRVGTSKEVPSSMPKNRDGHGRFGKFGVHTGGEGQDPNVGRWPANLAHDGSDEVLATFPESKGQQGDLKATGRPRPSSGRFGAMAPPLPHAARGDTGSAARFFYCAKASKADRGEGNTHPTVKPTALMRWLVRLVTQPGGMILDPFMGSGSTGVAAALEKLDFMGIEREDEAFRISEKRIERAFSDGQQNRSEAHSESEAAPPGSG